MDWPNPPASDSDTDILLLRRRPRMKSSRAPRACRTCRSRKVRCDAFAKRPQPCTNCILDGLPCEMAPRMARTSKKNGGLHRSESLPTVPSVQNVEVEVEVEVPFSQLTTSIPGPNVARSESSATTGAVALTHLSTASQHSNDECVTPPTPYHPASDLFEQAPFSVLCDDNRLPTLPPTGHDDDDLMAHSSENALPPFKSSHLSDLLDWPDECQWPDSDMLAHYMTLNDISHPTALEHGDVSVSVHVPRDTQASPITLPDDNIETSSFRSPVPWVADWSPANLSDDDSAALAENRIFLLPSVAEMESMIRVYFTHLHHKLPILEEYQFYLLVRKRRSADTGTQQQPEPMSLALLYAIMFAAWPYIASENPALTHHSSIRQRRAEIYSNAALLFRLDCERDPLKKMQICLLLSTYRSYPSHFHENERWILKAYRILQEVRVIPFNTNDSTAPESEMLRWRRVVIGWTHRMSFLIVGLKWISKPDLVEAISSLSRITSTILNVDVFRDDFAFSWHLSAQVKRELLNIFTATCRLRMYYGALGKILLKRSAADMGAMGVVLPEVTAAEVASAARTDWPDMMSIEDVERQIEEWRVDNAALLTRELPSSSSSAMSMGLSSSEMQVLHTQRLLLQMSYEYIISTLYQSTLVVERSTITKWAAGIIQSSRLALWDSICSTMDIFRCLIAEKVIHLLPADIIHVLLIPMTVYNLRLKTATAYDPSTIENLALCSQILNTLGKYYDVADFVADLLGASLVAADAFQRSPSSSSPSSSAATATPAAAAGDSSAASTTGGSSNNNNSSSKLLLPEPELHSAIIRFQNVALSIARMPPLEGGGFRKT